MDTPWFIPPSDFLAHLDAQDRESLMARAQSRAFQRNDAIFCAGSPGENVYILVEGRVKIFALSPIGKSVILWFCFPGEIFGLAEIARGGRREVDAEACTDSEVLIIPRAEFHEFLLQRPSAAMRVVDLLSCRLRAIGDMLLNLTTDDVLTRVIKLLVRLSARYGKPLRPHGMRLDINLTHQEIADMIGTSRQSVSTILSQLRRQGLLCIKNHTIQIENCELLEQLAADATLRESLLPAASIQVASPSA
jgi:CRP/FNR family transcriptional regulator, cyclic AMP receptor protein